MGRGGLVHWISEKELVLYASDVTYKTSIDQAGYVRISADSILVVPVLQGNYIVGLDWRAGRRGWWMTTAASFNTSGMDQARRLTRGISSASFPLGTRSMFYVPLGSTGLHRVSLPDGADRVVGNFPGLNVFFSVSGDGETIAYTENYRKIRFVLVEDVFH
jgi:hypothetical protein